MKNSFRLSMLFLFGSAILVGSYFATLQINSYFAIDGAYEGLTQPWAFHLISIKIILMAFFIFFNGNRFRYFLNVTGLILANSAAFAFLDYHRAISDQYEVYLLVFGLELLLFLVLGLIYNGLLKRRKTETLVDSKENPDKEPAILLASQGGEKSLDSLTDEGSKQNTQDLQSSLPEEMGNLGEEPESESKPDPKLKLDSESKPKLELEPEQKPEPQVEPKSESKLPGSQEPGNSTSCPIRIDIDMEDLKRCFEQYNRLSGKEEDIRLESKENEIQLRLEALSTKEQELNDRISVVKSKEKIIEKTINNLEQISKTIKDRTNMLEEKEEYIKRQMEWIEQREDGYSADVQNKLHNLLFEDLDELGGEVLIKDEKREIIINKADLSEIRRTIEETMEETKTGMEK